MVLNTYTKIDEKPVFRVWGLCSSLHMAWLLRWLLHGLLAAITALVLAIASWFMQPRRPGSPSST